jgi:hypothetical protein
VADARQEAKAEIVSAQETDVEFDVALEASVHLRGQLAQHGHDQVMKDKELGVFGRLVGSGASATMAIAAFAFIVTLALYVGLVVAVAVADERHAALLAPYPDKVLALTTLALGVVVGGKMKD